MDYDSLENRIPRLMHSSSRFAIVILVSLGLGTTAPAQDAPGCESCMARIDPGTISGNNYRNDALGFSYEVPAGWHIADKAMQEKQVEAVFRAQDIDEQEFARDQEGSKKCERVLLWATKYPEGSTGQDVNPRAIVVALDHECFPGISLNRTEREYAIEGVEGLRAAYPDASLVQEGDPIVRTFWLQHRHFLEVSISMTVTRPTTKKRVRIHSTALLTPLKDYWLAWVLVSDTHSGLQELRRLKVQFAPKQGAGKGPQVTGDK